MQQRAKRVAGGVVDSVIPLDRATRLYGHKITKAWQKSVEGILEVGALLVQAKADLDHGEFEGMVRKCCPFSVRTARQLMQIASNPVLSNRQRVADLPASWGTLAELSRLEPDELKHAIGNHWVKPEMTRDDVVSLRSRVKKALGKRVRDPRKTVASRPRPFASLLRAAIADDALEWLGSVDDDTGRAIAQRLALVIDELRRELTDG